MSGQLTKKPRTTNTQQQQARGQQQQARGQQQQQARGQQQQQARGQQQLPRPSSEQPEIPVSGTNAYFLIKNKCDGGQQVPAEQPVGIESLISMLPRLRIPEDTTFKLKAGLKAPISIVKVRKAAWDTLKVGLIQKATDSSTGTATTGIYISYVYDVQNGKYIITVNLVVQRQQQQPGISETFNLTELGKVFENAAEDEGEDDEGDEEEDEGEEGTGKKVKGALTRDTMSDSNKQMKEVDIAMFKIISILLLMTKAGGDAASKATNILTAFISVSSGKEYLDTGQLYAIKKKTTEWNTDKGYSDQEILGRCQDADGSFIDPRQQAQPQKFPRKPMLETIDGAATRIASNQYFASYCHFTLKDKKLKSDSTFCIDNADIFLLSIMVSLDPEVKQKCRAALIRPDVLSQQTYDLMLRIFSDTTNRSAQIDTFYYILSTPTIRSVLTNVMNVLNQGETIEGNDVLPRRVLLIDNELYFAMSAASFLYKFNTELKNGKNLFDELIPCNFDSLCHDNDPSRAYRLIMVLIFILKNDTNKIKENVQLMFPDFFDGDQFKVQYINETANSMQVFREQIFNETGELGSYIKNCIFKTLDQEQQSLFKILASKDAKEIEAGLYLRLKKKCCYVFQVLHTNLVAVVNCANSANQAFGPAREDLGRESNAIMGIQALDQGAFIPHYTYCAIDAPLKHGLSLSNYDIEKLDSAVLVTAITRNDAASQNMFYSEEVTDSICININIKKFNSSFSYEYVYGKTIKEVLKTVCPAGLDDDFCNEYNYIIQTMAETMFYYNKRRIGPFKDSIGTAVNCLLGDIRNNQHRDALSRLYQNAICGKPTPKKPLCSDLTPKAEAIEEAKMMFMNYFNNVMNGTNIEAKKELITKTSKLLELTSEVKQLNYLQTDVNDYLQKYREINHSCLNLTPLPSAVGQLSQTSRKRAIGQMGGMWWHGGMKVANPLQLSLQDPLDKNKQVTPSKPDPGQMNKQPVTPPATSQNGHNLINATTIPGTTYNFGRTASLSDSGSTTDESKSGSSSGSSTPIYDSQGRQINRGLFETPSPSKTNKKKLPDVLNNSGDDSDMSSVTDSRAASGRSTPVYDVLAQGATTNLPDGLQYSYYSLFGVYGFDLNINKYGEYEMIILNTPSDYNDYLNRYNLKQQQQQQPQQQQQQPQPQQQQPQQPPVGGRRKTGRKTKKIRKYRYKKRDTRRRSKSLTNRRYRM